MTRRSAVTTSGSKLEESVTDSVTTIGPLPAQMWNRFHIGADEATGTPVRNQVPAIAALVRDGRQFTMDTAGITCAN